MRQGQQNRRGRGRSSNNNNTSNNANRKGGQNPLTRSYESNGPDIKIRGNASHIAEKYLSLARDSHSSGDTVAAENYLQHAEHYNRIILAYREQQLQPVDAVNGSGPARPRMGDGEGDGGEDDNSDMSDPLAFGRFDSLPEQQPTLNQPQPSNPPPGPDYRQQRHDRPGYNRPQHDRHDRNERQNQQHRDPRREYRDPQRDVQREPQRQPDVAREPVPRTEAGDPPQDGGGYRRPFEPRRRHRANPPTANGPQQPRDEPGENFSQQPDFLTRPVRRRLRDSAEPGPGAGSNGREANGTAEHGHETEGDTPAPVDKSTV